MKSSSKIDKMFFIVLSLCFCLIIDGIPVGNKISKPIKNLEKVHKKGGHAQLNGGGVEGDMLFPPGYNPKSSTRGVAIYGNRQWPYGIIPYDMSAVTDENDRQTILESMQILMYAVATEIPNSNDRSACVYFRPRESNDQVYIKIQYGDGCSANVGYINNGYQSTVTLQKNGCFYYGTIQHELLHVLGFYHEQSRPDRDEYLEIHLENVEPDMVHNFNKYSWGSTVYNQGAPYDYSSIMHYDTTAFTMNGQPTMVPRRSGVTIGDAEELSPVDIAEVRHFYQCDA